MSNTATEERGTGRAQPDQETLLAMLKSHYESSHLVRRGICLLNAGRHEEAEAAFSSAVARGCSDKSLPSYLAACLLAQGDSEAAARQFARVAEEDAGHPAGRIRHALALWSAGQGEQAVEVLRKAIASNAECAELHFQLGTLLSALESYEEAELRFGQALSIDRDHTDAMVSLAMCCAVRGAPGEALKHLQRAQRLNPRDARVGLLLVQAAAALKQRGQPVHVMASIPSDESAADLRGIDELSRVIEDEPGFISAFLSIPAEQLDAEVLAVLAKALDAALERRTADAELHLQRALVLERLGRPDDAIKANERAVTIDPGFTTALVELGKLYARTDRTADAATRLEQAVAAGAEYADVYLTLGNVYRDQGLVGRAVSAYRRALAINEHLEAARTALASLPA